MSRRETGNQISPLEQSVSFASEELLLVDSRDVVIGHASKASAHAGDGQLHRAFSVFLFDHRQRVLVHQRSTLKPLWPGFWTNSCCSHPRRGETLEGAVRRRLREELGVTASPSAVYSFEYRAEFEDLGTEHELCHVFLAMAAQPTIRAHAEEIADYRWLSVTAVDALMQSAADTLTPWFKMEWQALRGTYRDRLDAFLQTIQTIESPRSVA